MVSLKSAYERITLSKMTLAFFLFSFAHCFAHGIIRSFLFTLDADTSTLVTDITTTAGVPPREIASLTGNSKEFQIKLCTSIPIGPPTNSCTVIFDSLQTNFSNPIPPGFRRSVVDDVPLISRSDMPAVMQPSYDSSGQIDGVNMQTVNGTTFNFDDHCTRLLVYPEGLHRDFVREDIVLITIQFWLLGNSILAIIYESTPHLLSVLVARVLLTNWSVFSLFRTGRIENIIERIVNANNSPCNFDIFAAYWPTRMMYEILLLASNSLGLLLAIFFSYKLSKMFNTRTFKSVGPPKEIIRIYRFFLAFLVCLEVSVFCLVAAMSLWITELMNGAIALISTRTSTGISLAQFVISITILLPWFTMGWFAVRREKKKLMAGFFVVGLVLTVSWALMFYSVEFRWTFINWLFFATLMTEALVGMTASCVLGVICWRNFDKGLAHYLYVENILAKDDFHPELFDHDEEKVPYNSDGTPQFLTIEDLKVNNRF